MMPKIDKDHVVEMVDTPYVKVFDLQYEADRHYYDVTRRTKDELMAVKSEETFRSILPDAVSCVIVLDIPGEEPRLCIVREYRYPIGRFVLSVPSGLVDQKDKKEADPIGSAGKREVCEETGIAFDERQDEIQLVNPLLYCSPGLTDESTAVVKIVLHRKQMPDVSQDGAVGAEVFDGIAWITRKQAEEYLRQGTDHHGIFYSAITWIALMTFVSDLW
jgi:ADP-ribose pyrophosphatase